jgi:hypothetical protein
MKLKDNTLEFFLSRQAVILLANATFFRLLKILYFNLQTHLITILLSGLGVSATILIVWYFWYLKTAENTRRVAVAEVRNNSRLIFKSDEFEAEIQKLTRLPKYLAVGIPVSGLIGAVLGLI